MLCTALTSPQKSEDDEIPTRPSGGSFDKNRTMAENLSWLRVGFFRGFRILGLESFEAMGVLGFGVGCGARALGASVVWLQGRAGSLPRVAASLYSLYSLWVLLRPRLSSGFFLTSLHVLCCWI